MHVNYTQTYFCNNKKEYTNFVNSYTATDRKCAHLVQCISTVNKCRSHTQQGSTITTAGSDMLHSIHQEQNVNVTNL